MNGKGWKDLYCPSRSRASEERMDNSPQGEFRKKGGTGISVGRGLVGSFGRKRPFPTKSCFHHSGPRIRKETGRKRLLSPGNNRLKNEKGGNLVRRGRGKGEGACQPYAYPSREGGEKKSEGTQLQGKRQRVQSPECAWHRVRIRVKMV